MNTQSSLRRRYFNAGAISLTAKGVVIASGIGILWLLNAIMGKEDFGGFMIALSTCLLIGGVTGSAFQSLVLYHCSRHYGNKRQKNSEAIIGLCLFLTLLSSGILGILMWEGADILAHAFRKPALQPWFSTLALFLPCHSLNLLLTAWHRAHQNIAWSTGFGEILPFSLRFIFLIPIWFFALDPLWAALAFIMASALPTIFLFALKPVSLHSDFSILTRWDISYALKSVTTQIINKPRRGLDVMLIGLLAPATAVADYTIAMRVAQLLLVPKQAFAELLIPRMGTLLDKREYTALWQEFDASRQATLLLAMAGSLFLLIAGPWILSFFGEYTSALPLLLILCAANLLHAGFGMVNGYASIAGYAGYSLLIGTTSSVLMLGTAVLLVPSLHGIGAGITIFIATLFTMIAFAALIKKYGNHAVLPLPVGSVLFYAVTVLTLSAFGTLSLTQAGLYFLPVLIALPFLDTSLLQFFRLHGRHYAT